MSNLYDGSKYRPQDDCRYSMPAYSSIAIKDIAEGFSLDASYVDEVLDNDTIALLDSLEGK